MISNAADPAISTVHDEVAAGDRPVNGKLPSLTGLRWLGAFMVFGFHVGTLNLIQTTHYHRKWDLVFGGGASGVSFFFVLSGFVLLWSARPGDTMTGFWRRRIAKVYPNHVVTWAIVIVLALWWWGDQLHGEVLIGNLFLIQPWLNVDNLPYSVNIVSWSLGCEAFFYLCFPLVKPLVKKASVRMLYAGIVVIPVIIYAGGPFAQHFFPVRDQYWFTYMFPPVRSLEFWLGVLVAELMVRGRWRGPGLWGATLVAVVIYVGTRTPLVPITVPVQWWSADLAVAYAILIAGAARADLTGVWSPWRGRVMVWLGEISFAFYMVHVMFISNVMRQLGRNGIGWSGREALLVVIPVALAGSLLLAWLLYRFVEVPMMRLLAPKRRRRLPEPRTGEPLESARVRCDDPLAVERIIV